MYTNVLQAAIALMCIKYSNDVFWLIPRLKDKSNGQLSLMILLCTTAGQLGIIGCLILLLYGKVWPGIIVLVVGIAVNGLIHLFWNKISGWTNRNTRQKIDFLDR